MIKGLFEIHITIDHTTPATAVHDLITFTLPRPDLKRTVAVNPRGDWPTQYMITKWSHGTETEVTAKTMKLVEAVRDHGLVIKRVKIESVASNDGVRERCERPPQATLTYFEFHAKMALPPGAAYSALEQDMEKVYASSLDKDLSVVAASFNLTGKTGAPIVDLRVSPVRGRDFAYAQKDLLMEGLKKLGYDIIGTLQSEYVVYDDNKALDKGWLA